MKPHAPFSLLPLLLFFGCTGSQEAPDPPETLANVIQPPKPGEEYGGDLTPTGEELSGEEEEEGADPIGGLDGWDGGAGGWVDIPDEDDGVDEPDEINPPQLYDEDEPLKTTRIRILSWNALKLTKAKLLRDLGSEEGTINLAQMVVRLRDTYKPSVICLQEVLQPVGSNVVELIRRALGGSWKVAFNTGLRIGNTGSFVNEICPIYYDSDVLGTKSKTSGQTDVFPGTTRRGSWAYFFVKNKRATPPPDGRFLFDFVVLSFHLSYANAATQLPQVEALVRAAASSASSYSTKGAPQPSEPDVIVCGDFNVNPGDAPWPAIQADWDVQPYDPAARTMVASRNSYDQIYWGPETTEDWAQVKSVVPLGVRFFWPNKNPPAVLLRWVAKYVSDHNPHYADFKTSNDEDP